LLGLSTCAKIADDVQKCPRFTDDVLQRRMIRAILEGGIDSPFVDSETDSFDRPAAPPPPPP
jgi:hypothetical protein